ncbi:sodium/pantothenate symporter [Scopulibacillus darangshiensis]|uniref:Sodium/pantothenate symporter n=1 Tax=Scopulibacillus darangshiensis TaxID=442528 RepID=A0A4R2P2C5_9BACL|nr:sodium/pantothenate symporter [Scopulibacillus darangshiensis]TCP28772.1 sodium/pantothenate symporter [Scopulibacillus darangshiensis]
MNWSVVIPMILFIIVVFLVGIYASKATQRSDDFLQEYFLGSRQLGGFILAMTMVTTYGSASSFIGGPGVAYTVGLSWVLLAMSQVVTGYIVLTVLGKKFAIMARKIKAVTLIDFLRERYQSKWVVILSALSIIIFLFSSMAAQWVGGGRLIQSVTGLPYLSALFIFAISVLVYVIIGGFRAVAITDAIQGIVMFAGTLIILIGTIIAGGGVDNIISDLKAIDPGLITPYGPDHQFSAAYISSFWILVGVGVVGLPQVAVRAMSYKDSKAMHRALIIGTIVVGVVMLGMHLSGVFARAVMPDIKVGDKVMPLLAIKVLPAWVAGVVLSAPMAAIMSTVNALLLLVSSSIIKDVYLNYIKQNASHQRVKRLSMGITGIVGVLVLIMAIKPPDLLIWLNLFAFGGLEAAFIWPVVMGLYWKRGNAYGALTSIIVGVVSYICFSTFIPSPFGMHAIVMPVILSFFGYVAGSLLTKDVDVFQQNKIISKFWSV